MPDILVRNLDKETVQRLKARAKRNRRSLQAEAKLVLEDAATMTVQEWLEMARQTRESLGKTLSDSTELIREDRER